MSDKKSTKIVKAGRRKEWTQGLVNPPVYHASTVLFDTYAALREGVKKAFSEELFYGRLGTPTLWALEDAMAELESARGAKIFPSGMAAIAASLLSVLKSGDHVLFSDTVYEPTRKLAKGLLPRLGIEADFFDPLIGKDITKKFKSNTRAVFVETPGSLTFEVPDLPAIAKAAHERDMFVLCDNTWATPLFHNALEHGADISIHAATKYIVGHSDAMLGIASSGARTYGLLKRTSFQLGQITGPDDAYLGLRGLRTLEVRLKQHEKNGLEIAKWLQDQPLVAKVLHPALSDCPGHDIWQRDFTGASGLFSIVLKGGEMKNMGAFCDELNHFGMGFSWGGFESLVLPQEVTPVRSATEWNAPGPLIRLHIGLEDVDDLKEDLGAALKRFQKTI
ncbi:MAG: cystathionine beta-lyase [Alphaproteobacteria bacterium]